MKSNHEVYEDLLKKYTPEEIADFAMIPEEAGEAAREAFVAFRMERLAALSEQGGA